MSNFTGSYFYLIPDPGYIKISGPDRLDFLQRQSSNDLRLLSQNEPVVTVLTSPTGRIVDVLWVVDEGNETYGVLTLPGQSDQTAEFLSNRIFFMDKITLQKFHADLSQIELIGDGISHLLRDVGVIDPSDNMLYTTETNGIPVRFLHHHQLGSRLLVPSSDSERLISSLKGYQFQPLSAEDYNIMRVENGRPAAKHELVEDFSPLEIGYRWAVADNKGCYTGQEVLARQINYDKVTKHLVGLQTSELAMENQTLYSIDTSQPVGTITSVVNSPRFGNIALGVVKRPYQEPGTELFIRLEDTVLPAVTSTLPFE